MSAPARTRSGTSTSRGRSSSSSARARHLKTYLIALVDDHSRFILGLRIAEDARLEGILAWLRDCIELCGKPLELMSDNGSPFVYWIPGVLTRFGKTLEALAVRHIRTQVNSPWTNGKVERFWGLLQAEVLDRQVFRSLAKAEAALAEYVRTTTTTGSTARSAGSPRPSGSMGRPSRTAASRTSPPWRTLRVGWRTCVQLPEPVSITTGNYT